MAVEIRAATYAALRTALAAGTYQAGQMVFVESIDGTNTNGAGVFKVKYDAGGGFVDDGGVTLTSADGTWAAERLLDGSILAEWFGYVGPAADSYAAIQAAIYAADSEVILPAGAILCESTIDLPVTKSIIGQGSKITSLVSSSSGVYTANAMVLANTSDGITWDVAYPNIGSGVIKGIQFDNNTAQVSGLIGVIAAGSYVFDDIRGYRMAQIIKTTGDYNDNVRIGRIISREAGTGWQIEVGNLGDDLVIDSCHFPERADSSLPNGVRVVGCSGGTVRGVVGGNMQVFRSAAVTVLDTHMEGSNLTIDSSSIDVRNFFCTPSETGNANIICADTDVGGYSVNISGYQCSVWDDALPSPYTPYDIKLNDSFHVSIEACYKRASRSSDTGISHLAGVIVQKEDGSEFSDFSRFAHVYSQKCVIGRFQKIISDASIPCGSGLVYVNSSSQTNSGITWRADTGTYYYKFQYIYDTVAMVGQTESDAARAFAMTNGGDGLLHVLVMSSRSMPVICRIYRGPSSGAYDEYVDVPILNARYVLDDGVLANGHPWKARVSGSAENVNASMTHIARETGRIVMRGSGAPAQGTFAVGDLVINSAPSAGGNAEWICTTAGTPGTWKTAGIIAV